MKRAALGLCVATAFAVSVAAQQPPATTPQPATPSQTPAAAAAGETSLTGCLAKGADGGFTLTNVQQASASASAPSGTSGAAATPSPSGAGAASSGASASASAGPSATWMLKGGDLAAHVGHRITVTGKAASASASASGATSTTGAAGAPGATTDPAASRPAATSGSASMRTLEVSSVKMVSQTCQ